MSSYYELVAECGRMKRRISKLESALEHLSQTAEEHRSNTWMVTVQVVTNAALGAWGFVDSVTVFDQPRAALDQPTLSWILESIKATTGAQTGAIVSAFPLAHQDLPEIDPETSKGTITNPLTAEDVVG